MGEKSKRRDAKSKERGKICREQREGGGVGAGGRAAAECYLGLENIVFLSAGWLNQFSSV
jgi:hypothetical protein